jgi:hypothetical protein
VRAEDETGVDEGVGLAAPRVPGRRRAARRRQHARRVEAWESGARAAAPLECHFAAQLNQFIPAGFLSCSVAGSLEGQSDMTTRGGRLAVKT